MSDTQITYLADGHVRTLVFPACAPSASLEDGNGVNLSLKVWGEHYLKKYGATTVRMIEIREGDFPPRRLLVENGKPFRIPEVAR